MRNFQDGVRLVDNKLVHNGRWCVPTPLVHGLVAEYHNALHLTTSDGEKHRKEINHGVEGEGLYKAVELPCQTCHCPQAVRHCIAGVPLPTGPRQWDGVLLEVHCPLPPGSGAVQCNSSTAHRPQAVRQCIVGGPLPNTPRQRGSALQEFHCPLPPCSTVVHCRSSTAHCPQE